MPTTGSHPRSLVSLDYSQYHRHYHLSSWSSLAPRRARSGGQPRRTWGQAHELCSDRALRRPAVARCAAPPGAAPMPFPAFRCLNPKRAVALLGHRGPPNCVLNPRTPKMALNGGALKPKNPQYWYLVKTQEPPIKTEKHQKTKTQEPPGRCHSGCP